MVKQYLKLQSVGNATTRIVSINAELVRKFVPNATRDTTLYGKWSYNAERKVLELEIREGLPETTTS